MRWNDLHHPHTEALAIRTFIKYHGRHPDLWVAYNWPWVSHWGDHEEWIKSTLGCYRKTRVPCSCYMCMNSRHNPWLKEKDRIPIKERRQLQAMEYQLEEYEKEK